MNSGHIDLYREEEIFASSPMKKRIIADSSLRIDLSFRIIVTLVSLATLCGCGYVDAPDPFYLQMGGVSLAIPSAYVHAGSGLDVPQYRNELRLGASKPPGVEIAEIYMVLDAETLQPYGADPKRRGNPNRQSLWLFDLETHPRETPESYASYRSRRERRTPSRDEFGLTAYEDGRPPPEGGLNYLARIDDGSSIALRCSGLTQINPTCQVNFMWNGLAVQYYFRYAYLRDWREVQKRTVALLDTFFRGRIVK